MPPELFMAESWSRVLSGYIQNIVRDGHERMGRDQDVREGNQHMITHTKDAAAKREGTEASPSFNSANSSAHKCLLF